MTAKPRQLPRIWGFTLLLCLCVGCSDKPKPVAPEEPLPSPFTTDVMTESWLAIEHNGGVTIMHPDSSEVRMIPDVALHSWSPGATWLAVKTGKRSLSTYNLQSGEMYSLYEDGSFGAWSPDASRVAYSLREAPDRIWIRDVVSGDHRVVAPGAVDQQVVALVTVADWSSDGRWIAAQMTTEETLSEGPPWMFLIPATDRDPVFLGPGNPGSFSPDSQWLLYEAGDFENYEYRLLNVGTSDDLLMAKVIEVGPALWSPVDLFVAFATERYQIRLSGPKQGSRQLATGLYQRWSPDGNWIAYLDEYTMLTWIVRIVSPRGDVSKMVSETIPYSAPFSWSPDSRLMAVVVSEGHVKTGIYLVDPQTRERRRVADGSRVLWSPTAHEIVSP